jgi:hypothetical protein
MNFEKFSYAQKGFDLWPAVRVHLAKNFEPSPSICNHFR